MQDFVALLGVKGGPAIRPGSNMPTSTLVSLAGRTILVDAGLGATRGVCDQGIALGSLDAIVVTHLHSDHYLELGPLLHTSWTAGLNRTMPVFGPPRLARYWTAFLEAMRDDIDLRIADEGRPDLARLVEIRPLDTECATVLGDVTLRAMENVHPPVEPSYALRIEGGGKAVVLSGDTAFMPEMAVFASGADLLVHEAMLEHGVDALIAKVPNGGERLRTHILRSHTSAEDAGRVAGAAGVARLALNHFVPDGLPEFTEDDWKRAVRRTWDGAMILGRDGLRIDL
ncbi:MBL fold metallo-hydrolase [Roseibacterium sp. SDUM158017]|uniref:MBL fold metallo-hydrolase n=1 Tax=Roseicyclus salinarum TaxID=3036773 RepID=UPI002414E0BC|nr:MBL fold metallo-hydrolase [Roseibacterium sp. SDUM158017]MDG4650512.1 MBL fold metallo-hydrolase [Roseibacterium sp. SDUM158017]